MAQDLFHYDKMVENALRGVARTALAQAARDGLRGGHHFYVGFRTTAADVVLPPQLLAKFPEEMTIVLQHQYWGLEVGEHAFSVSLSFQSRMERLTIPFAAITSFADPSVNFGLQFETLSAPPAEPPAALAEAAADEPPTDRPSPDRPSPDRPSPDRPSGERPVAEIVTLDRFRKR